MGSKLNKKSEAISDLASLYAKNHPKSNDFGWFIGCGGGIWTSRPPGYEPDELPGCSTPRYFWALQKDALLECFMIIAHCFAFVNTFLKIFSNLFSAKFDVFPSLNGNSRFLMWKTAENMSIILSAVLFFDINKDETLNSRILNAYPVYVSKRVPWLRTCLRIIDAYQYAYPSAYRRRVP